MKKETMDKPATGKLPSWKQKKLEELTPQEWEALCDGCAKCCLYKLEDDKTGKIYHTNVACKLLNTHSCRCSSYKKRKQLIKTCAVLTPKNVLKFPWLPRTCAYRLLSEGKELFNWHYLVCNDRDMVHRLGISVKDRVISETYVHPEQLTDHIIDWD